ncbi:MAG TPA: ABC transporter ATP-binding protein [Steroidobacteraceae bacterium]|nr:ABC transporter ATP-binding protein [Steroidobacteraceae bacterium]
MMPALNMEDLRVRYGRPAVEAVDGVSLKIFSAECVGVVGESGSGKTQLFMAAMGLLPGAARVSGRIQFEGNELLAADGGAIRQVRGSKLTMIFQDPMTALTPHLTIGTQLAEVLVTHRGATWKEALSAAGSMLERVRVPEPERRLHQHPHELSGGMRQRVLLAMSLLCEPALLIADEPTTALDVTVQAEIIELLRAVRREFGAAIALISHDLAVIASLADRIYVMYAGRIVEQAAAPELFRHPRHPYTAELLECIPSLTGPRLARLPTILGQPPRPGEKLEACAFAPRCPRAAERCRIERPVLRGPSASQVACHFPLTP